MVKNKTEITGADGGPIQSTGIDLSNLSFEQLMQLRKNKKLYCYYVIFLGLNKLFMDGI